MFKKKKNPLLEDEKPVQEIEKQSKEKQLKSKKEKPPQKAKSSKNWFKQLTDRQKLGTLLIVVTVIVMFIITPLYEYGQSTQEIEIVVATNEIKKGNQISESDISTIIVKKNSAFEGLYSNIDSIIGTYALSDILVEEPIVRYKISPTIPFDDGYLYTLGEEKVAVSITLKTLASSVSSKVQQGDIVSIYSYNNASETSVLHPELNYVRVLDVTDTEGYSVDNSDSIISTVTLELASVQAKLLVGLEQNSELHIALITRGDDEKTSSFLAEQEEILSQIVAFNATASDSMTSEEDSGIIIETEEKVGISDENVDETTVSSTEENIEITTEGGE